MILGTKTDKLYSFLGFGDPPARMHLLCHMYLLSYFCSSYTNMFSHHMYLVVEDKKIANPFVGHVLSDEWSPYHYVKESGSVNQPKAKDVEKVGTVPEEGKIIKHLLKKPLKSPRMMLKPSKMRRMFKCRFSMQFLMKN